MIESTGYELHKMSPQSHILSKFCKTLHKGSREGTIKFQPDWIDIKIQWRQGLAWYFVTARWSIYICTNTWNCYSDWINLPELFTKYGWNLMQTWSASLREQFDLFSCPIQVKIINSESLLFIFIISKIITEDREIVIYKSYWFWKSCWNVQRTHVRTHTISYKYMKDIFRLYLKPEHTWLSVVTDRHA